MLPFTLDHELRENLEIERMLVELKKPTRRINEPDPIDAHQHLVNAMGKQMALAVDKMIMDSLKETSLETTTNAKKWEDTIMDTSSLNFNIDC